LDLAGLAKLAVVVASAIGFWAAALMYAKTRVAERGELTEPSVVTLPEARLFFSVPNALFGMLFYAVTIAIELLVASPRLAGMVLLIPSALAFGTSCYLAARLIARKRSCPRCWTGHAVNLAIVLLIAAQLELSR
jgi:uncharacterized membrane protein